MKVVQINSTCGSGSTGRICVSISRLLSTIGIENYILYSIGSGNDYPFGIKYSSTLLRYFQTIIEKVFGINGFGSRLSTHLLLKKLKRIKPAIVHVHNIHSHDVNLRVLFNYLRKNRITVYWTFHDCWAFTGGCPHFDMIGCDLWQFSCGHCPQYKSYSLLFDNSAYILREKKKAYGRGLDLTIITPSQWLASLVKQSFLCHYPAVIINNGIDHSIFKPTSSNFREKHHCSDKYILLGVAYGWSQKKGLDVYIELAQNLGPTFQIVLVGTNDSIDAILPSNIISIHRTHNQEELAQIYTTADLFIQFTREENFPTVNIESLACGTPVLTFDTGGSPEIIDPSCGLVVPKNDVKAALAAIIDIRNNHPFQEKDCISRSYLFKAENKFQEYIDLYLHRTSKRNDE